MPFLLLLCSAVLTALDQFFKMLVVTNIKPVGALPVIPGLLEIVYTENTGISFGLFQGASWVFLILTTLLTLALIAFMLLYKHKNAVFLRFVRVACVLLIAGAAGNVIDRFAFGHVVDYISVSFFPFIFNFADCCVVVGGFIFFAGLLYLNHAEKAKAEETADQIAEETEQTEPAALSDGGTEPKDDAGDSDRAPD